MHQRRGEAEIPTASPDGIVHLFDGMMVNGKILQKEILWCAAPEKEYDNTCAFELSNAGIFKQKLNYIHNNPVAECIVGIPVDYIYSRARDYRDIKGFINITLPG